MVRCSTIELRLRERGYTAAQVEVGAGMNSIRRPRSRPRKVSVNFRVLKWVLTREAVLRMAANPSTGREPWSPMRRWLCGMRTDAVVHLGEYLERKYKQPAVRR